MANRYANLPGGQSIGSTYKQIDTGFDRVQQDVDQLQDETDELDRRIDTIINEPSEGKDAELVDIRTPASGYVPDGPIEVAGDMTRDMQKQFVKHKAETTTQFDNLVSSKNLVPLFDTGLWVLRDTTVDSPIKITLTADIAWRSSYIYLDLKGDADYFFSTTTNGRATVRTGHDVSGGVIANNNNTFIAPPDGKVTIRLDDGGTPGTYTFEDVMLVEGSESPGIYFPRFREDIPNLVIVESGSNANGNYVRFADGTQVCWRELNLGYGSSVQLLAQWTFPASFMSEPMVEMTLKDVRVTVIESQITPSVEDLGVMGDSLPSSTSARPRIYLTAGASRSFSSEDVLPVYVKATGRWK